MGTQILTVKLPCIVSICDTWITESYSSKKNLKAVHQAHPRDSPAHEESSEEPPWRRRTTYEEVSPFVKAAGGEVEGKSEEGIKTASLKAALYRTSQWFTKSNDKMILYVEFWTREEVLETIPSCSHCYRLAYHPWVIRTSRENFSIAEDSSSGKLHRLVDKNLEREVLIRKNRQYPIGFLFCELWS